MKRAIVFLVFALMAQLVVGQALTSAAEDGDWDKVKTLVEQGANVNTKKKNGNNESALYFAPDQLNFEMVKYLVEHGADVNIADKRGLTLLMDTLGVRVLWTL